MITSSHMIYHWALARRLDTKLGICKTRVFGAIIGGLIPDVSIFLFFLYQTLAQIPHDQIWEVLYFNSAWTPFITLSHSFILWPILIVSAYIFHNKLLFWIASGALLHSMTDFLVHANDAYKHFWPLSDWKWQSPISYWNPQFFGNIVGALDAIFVVLLLVYLAKKVETKRTRGFLIIVGFIYVAMAVLTFHLGS